MVPCVRVIFGLFAASSSSVIGTELKPPPLGSRVGQRMLFVGAIGAARHAELVGRRVERAVARRLEELKADLEGEGLWRDDVAHAGAAH